MVENTVTVVLTRDEALVLNEWLHRFNRSEYSAAFRDQAEQRVLWDLQASLEPQLPEVVDADYEALLRSAWDRLRDANE